MNQFLRVVIVVLAFVGIFLAGSITGGVATAEFMSGRQRDHNREFAQRNQQEYQAKLRLLQQQYNQANNAVRQQLQAAQQQVRQLQQFIAQQPRGGQQRMGPWRKSAPEGFAPVLMQRIFNQVQPTSEEREKIRPLIFQASEDLRRLRRDTAHQSEIIVEHLEDAISGVLTPAQLDRFNELIQQWRERMDSYNREQQEFEAEQRLMERQQQQQRRQQQQKKQPPPPAQPPSPAIAPAASAAPAN